MNKLAKLKYVGYSTLALALMALPTMAQAGAAAGDNAFTVNAAKAIGAGIGFGIAAGFAGIGQGLVGKGATEGVARNPGAAGTVQTMDAEAIGRASVFLGAGRTQAHDDIDYAVGFSQIKKVGERVEVGEPLLFVHARDDHSLASVLPMLDSGIAIS